MMLRRAACLALAWGAFSGLFLSHQAFCDEVPQGELQKHVFDRSDVFPGTTRDYWVYIPAQYDASEPACLFVCQDGVQYEAPSAFDELIAKKEMPVLIGVFVSPGRVPSQSDEALDRFNRSVEYDGLGDAYARFLIDELLPAVERLTTADGRPIRISRKPDDRAIAGNSSGAVCAFTAAWERPDSFRRVFSAIGTYVGLRGGDVYPTLIRKVEPKPLRVFLQDGSGDLNIYGGDWWMANQSMERALTYAGYEVTHEWGEGGHDSRHATEIFRDAMRWLWKDWPTPIQAGAGSDKLQEILIPGEAWTIAAQGVGAAGLAVDDQGAVYVADATASHVQRLSPDGGVEPVDDAPAAILDALQGRITRSDGVTFRTLPGAGDTSTTGRQVEAARSPESGVLSNTGLTDSGTLVLSPDQSLLYIADRSSRWVHSYQVQSDLSLSFGQRYYHFHVRDDARDAGLSGLCVDRDGRLYAGTSLGVQVCDQAGRVNAIIPTPGGGASAVALGGSNFDVLYVVSGNDVYRRKVRPQGLGTPSAPVKPAPPRL